MRVELGNLAREGIEARLGAGAEAGARTAMRRYADRLGAGEATPLPNFLRDLPAPSGPESGRSFELDIDAESLAVLEREAERQEVPVEKIASHAVLAYLAELDAISAIAPVGLLPVNP